MSDIKFFQLDLKELGFSNNFIKNIINKNGTLSLKLIDIDKNQCIYAFYKNKKISIKNINTKTKKIINSIDPKTITSEIVDFIIKHRTLQLLKNDKKITTITKDDLYIHGYYSNDNDNIDIWSFQFIKNSDYAKDNKNIYFIEQIEWWYSIKKVDCDYDTFEYLDNNITKDKNNIYYFWRKFAEMDKDTFQNLWYGYIKNGYSIYYFHFSEDFYESVITYDHETFKVLKYWYAKDKDYVYKNWNEYHYKQNKENNNKDKDYDDKYWDKRYYLKPESFKLLNAYYIKNKYSAYYNEWHENRYITDAENFKIIKWKWATDESYLYYEWFRESSIENHRLIKVLKEYYAKDNKNIYFCWAKSKEETIDINTFQELHYFYAKDKNNVYYRGEIIYTADPNSFETLDEPYYAKDKNNIYFYGKILPTADPNSFEILDKQYFNLDYFISSSYYKYYAKDNFNIYYCNIENSQDGYNYHSIKILKEADYYTFQTLWFWYAKDKYNIYDWWVEMYIDPKMVDIDSFHIINREFARDRYSIFDIYQWWDLSRHSKERLICKDNTLLLKSEYYCPKTCDCHQDNKDYYDEDYYTNNKHSWLDTEFPDWNPEEWDFDSYLEANGY